MFFVLNDCTIIQIHIIYKNYIFFQQSSARFHAFKLGIKFYIVFNLFIFSFITDEHLTKYQFSCRLPTYVTCIVATLSRKIFLNLYSIRHG